MQPLRLFNSHNPLEDRLGKAFFDELPTQPGVYLMYGQAGRLLYVGKAKNLRNRLFTYRRVRDDNSSRKVRRLVRMTHTIDIELCDSEEAALIKENALIREHRPEERVYRFRLGMRQPEDEDQLSYTYGAFKGHRTIRKGTGALLRQLYLLEHEVSTPFEFPSVLTNKLTPLKYDLPFSGNLLANEELQGSLRELLSGESLQFLELLIGTVSQRNLMHEYIGRLILKDCESIRRLFDHCLQRNYTLKQKLNLPDRLIPQEKLDDYLVRVAFWEDK